MLDLSETYTIYGVCDDGFIVCSGEEIAYYGEIYRINHGRVAVV